MICTCTWFDISYLQCNSNEPSAKSRKYDNHKCSYERRPSDCQTQCDTTAGREFPVEEWERSLAGEN